MRPVSVKNINKSFGDRTAVKDISFEVNPGVIYGIIGPDGAGKTTLFRMIASLLLPDSGTIELGDIDVVKDYKKVRRVIGYMPGKFSLYPDLSVEENLKFFARIFGVSIEENYDLIRPMYHTLEPFKKRKASDLSGGMKQKLALSCALVHRPELLLLDEPTTGVDPVSRQEFWDGLIGLKETGLTMLVSTAYMDEAGLCDEITLVQNGSIISTGRPADLVEQYPGELWTVRTGSRMDVVHLLRGNPDVISAYPRGAAVAFHPKPGISAEAILRDAAGQDFSLSDPEKITPSIEDVFLNEMLVNE